MKQVSEYRKSFRSYRVGSTGCQSPGIGRKEVPESQDRRSSDRSRDLRALRYDRARTAS